MELPNKMDPEFVQGTIVSDMNFSSQSEIINCIEKYCEHQSYLQTRLDKRDMNSCISLYLYKKKDRKQIREKILEIDLKIEELLAASARIDFAEQASKKIEHEAKLRKEKTEWEDMRKYKDMEYKHSKFDKSYALTLISEIDDKISVILNGENPNTWEKRNEISSLRSERDKIGKRLSESCLGIY
jgi:hypothetical protein